MQTYKKLSYAEIRVKLVDLAKKFPEVIKLETAEEKLDIPYLIDCSSTPGDKCVLDIVTLTDLASPPEEKV